MIAVVMRHAAGWLDHRLVARPRVVLGDLFGRRWAGWQAASPDREVIDGEVVDDVAISLERYDDPVEHRLLAELDTSAAVYADWLDEQGRPAFAELLRLQLEAPRHAFRGEAYARIEARLAELATALPEGWRHVATRPLIHLGDALQFRIGSRRTPHPDLRTVQIWAGRHHLTPFDDTAYVPQLASSLGHDRDAVAAAIRGARTDLRLFDHGPTTDDLRCAAHLDGDDLVLELVVKVYPHDGGEPHDEPLVVRLRAAAFVELLDEVIAALVTSDS